MEYLEKLPANCPANHAADVAINAVYRIVSGNNPGIQAFLSNAALDLLKPPTVDDCKWASCSLFKSREKAENIAKKLAKTRINNPHLSLCNIGAGIGKSYDNGKSHVDFWPFKNFDPAMIILRTESL